LCLPQNKIKKQEKQKENGHEKGLCPVTLYASLHMQMAEQGTSARKGKAEAKKGCGGDQACSIVLYFYSCIGNFSCWQSALASHTLPPLLSREERKKKGSQIRTLCGFSHQSRGVPHSV